MASLDLQMIRPMLWDLSQKIFGADAEKERLYFDALEISNPSSPILDFGCATGNASAGFVGYNYTGIDIDQELIAFARFKFRAHSEMKFVAEDIAKFRPAEPFDFILFAGVAHHLDDTALPAILKTLHSLLSNDGHIYFIDPVVTSDEGPLLRLLMSLDQGKFHRPADAYVQLFASLGYHVYDRKALKAKDGLFPTPQMEFFKVR